MVSLVTFTLYGIEGIGSQLEDPFGYDRNDIKMDAIVGDSRVEIEAVLGEWRRVLGVVDEYGDWGGGGVGSRRAQGQGGAAAAAGNGFVLPDLFVR